MGDDEWRRVDISFTTHLLRFRVEGRSGETIDTEADPRAKIFIRDNGDEWSADTFMGFFLKKSGKEIVDYAPLDLIAKDRATVEFPVDIPPEGTFRVQALNGELVDVARVVVSVEFRRVKH